MSSNLLSDIRIFDSIPIINNKTIVTRNYSLKITSRSLFSQKPIAILFLLVRFDLFFFLFFSQTVFHKSLRNSKMRSREMLGVFSSENNVFITEERPQRLVDYLRVKVTVRYSLLKSILTQ